MTQQLITMTPRELSRYGVITKLIDGFINGTEAAKQLSLTIRQVKNIKARVIKEGQRGIIHRNRGKSSNRRMPEAKIKEMKKIIGENYHDFGPLFASEKLEEIHEIKIGKETLRLLMVSWGYWIPKPRKKNGEYRHWRQRKEYYGEMEQFDGSYHLWFEDRGPTCCLLASIDDATGKINKLKFGHDEGVIPVFTFWKEYIEKRGKPLSIYVDRHSTYKQNQKSVFDDPNCFTQFQRAMERDLGIKIIHAYSAQAKGRVERLFGTLQDRLIKELRLANISSIEEANKFVKEVFIPKFNARFARVAQKKRDLHKSLTKFEKAHLDQIFSIQKTRVVNNDFTIRYEGKWFQLAETQPTLVLRKERVLIEERIDGKIFISLRGKYLNYKVLPARPEKVKMKVIGLTRTKPSWKPPANHPWRRLPINPEKMYKTSSLT